MSSGLPGSRCSLAHRQPPAFGSVWRGDLVSAAAMVRSRFCARPLMIGTTRSAHVETQLPLPCSSPWPTCTRHFHQLCNTKPVLHCTSQKAGLTVSSVCNVQHACSRCCYHQALLSEPTVSESPDRFIKLCADYDKIVIIFSKEENESVTQWRGVIWWS